MVMLGDGSGKTVEARSNADLLDPDWFPDGTHIVMCRAPRNGVVLRMRLLIAAADGSSVVAVGPRGSSEPSVSPDATKIAFTRYTRKSRRNVWVMNADGTGVAQITTDGRSTAPSWSPDGSRIAFVRRVKAPNGSGQQRDIFVMNADGTGRKRLTDGARLEHAPTWSPDGTLIVFERTIYWDPGSSTDLWTIMPDGSNPTELLHTPGVYEQRPDWQAT
jgi:Tol biopolymer transport system component